MSKQAISKTYIREIAHDCGVERMRPDVIPFIQEQCHDYIRYLISEGKIFMTNKNKITMTVGDLKAALERTL